MPVRSSQAEPVLAATACKVGGSPRQEVLDATAGEEGLRRERGEGGEEGKRMEVEVEVCRPWRPH